MNLSIPCLILLILLAGLVACSGCTATTGPAPQATTMTPDTTTPVRTTTILTRAPTDEIARITVDHFGPDPSTGDVYEFTGAVSVTGGSTSRCRSSSGTRTARSMRSMPAAWAGRTLP